jgi:DNA-binding SARP family transcriptional activator
MEDSHNNHGTQNTLETMVHPLEKSPDHEPAPMSDVPFEDTKNYQPSSALAGNGDSLPALYFTCFGRFEVRRLGQPVSLCSNRNGQAILRYLLAQVGHRANMDTLMGVLWPEDEPEVAHHKLQVALSALRRSLNHGYACDPGGGYILYKNRIYQLNPAVPLKSDVDEFLALYQAGQQSSGSVAAAQYEKACQLYTGPFLTEDLYADWSFFRREQLSQAYLTMCSTLAEHYLEAGHYEDGVKWATATLKENRCDETAHQQLMRAYVAMGRRSDALRQYQRCQHVLNEELGVPPMPETVELFHTILHADNTHERDKLGQIERK